LCNGYDLRATDVRVNPNPINPSVLANERNRRFVNHATKKATESRLILFKSQS
jgi:hypothetical protein